MKERLALTFLFAALVALPAAAQTQNPSSVTFDHADFATAAHYDGGYFQLLVKVDNTCDLLSAPAVAPMATDNLGKPATTTGVSMSATLSAKPIGCYVMKVRVLDASGLYSDWSLPSDPFVRKPATPGKPVAK
jgi:hypothetical protein